MNHLFQNRCLICMLIILFVCAIGGAGRVSGLPGSGSGEMKELNRDGYTISFPSSWTVEEESDSVSISLPDRSGSVFIRTGPKTSDVSDSHQAFLEQSIQSAISEFHLAGFSIISENTGSIYGMPAVSTVFTFQDKSGAVIVSVLYTMITDDGVLHLMFTNTPDRYESTLPGFEDILRSLELTRTSGTSVAVQQALIPPSTPVAAITTTVLPKPARIPAQSPDIASDTPSVTLQPTLAGDLTPVPAPSAGENENAKNARMIIADAYEQGDGEKVYSLMAGKSREVHTADMKITGEFGKKMAEALRGAVVVEGGNRSVWYEMDFSGSKMSFRIIQEGDKWLITGI